MKLLQFRIKTDIKTMMKKVYNIVYTHKMQIYPKTEDSDTSLWCIIWLWCQNNNIIIIIVLCVEPFVVVHFFLMSITYQNTRERRHPFVKRQFEGCLILLWIDNAFRNSLENTFERWCIFWDKIFTFWYSLSLEVYLK